MDKLQNELAGKLKTLHYRQGKTDEVIAKRDRLVTERQKTSIVNIAEAINSLKETIEEKKFGKGESEEDIATWAGEIDNELAMADESIRKLTQIIKECDLRDQDDEAAYKHEKNMLFEKQLLAQKAEFEEKLEAKKANEAQQQQQQSTQHSSAVTLPKLLMTKFNGKVEAWLPFWGKFRTEIDATNLPVLTKFSYLKDYLEESVRRDIDGLPFTEAGYDKAKIILEAEYGQTSEVTNSYMQNIMNLPVISGKDPSKVNEFYKQLRYNVHSLDTLGKLADVKGNVRATLDKLKGMKADLVRGDENWRDWGYEELLRELKKWREINPIDEKPESNSKYTNQNKQRSKFFHARDSPREARVPACVYCEDTTHKSTMCPSVVKREERREILAKKRMCFNCTGTKHRASDCKSKVSCQVCHKRHHTSICDEADREQHLLKVANGSTRVTHPIVVVEVSGVKCRALLDSGSGSSYASAALLERIPHRASKKEVRKIDMMLGATTREVELSTIDIKGKSGTFSLPVEVTKVNKGELLFVDNPHYKQLIDSYPHLAGVEMDDRDNETAKLPVHIILGASEYAKLKTEHPPKVGKTGEPVAELTKFGWTIMSPGTEGVDLTNLLLTQTSQADYEELCRLDVLGLKDRPANDQGTVYDEFKEQLTRDEAGWYETGLPWRSNHPPLPSNQAGSLRRLSNLSKKLDRQQLTERYDQIVEDQKAEGVVESAEEPAVEKEFYIPHKPVVKPGAESTKLRIVYDASARAHSGAPSLNECLNPGPPLQNKLWDVLVRSRFHPVALTGDMQKAFLQVRIREADRDVLRFHWKASQESEIQTLRFTRALFGLTSSPFLLGGVIDSHLSTWEKQEPELVTKLRCELYVDDLITGSTTVPKAQELKAKTTSVFRDACITLHKWHSNEKDLETEQPKEEETTYAKQQLGTPGGQDCSLLGLNWCKRDDTLSVPMPETETVLTKRGILATLAKVYDPLGFISPWTLQGKLVYRAVCDTKSTWDAPLSTNHIRLWNQWNNQMPEQVSLPRSLVTHREDIEDIELHSFGDASGNGVAACTYAVVRQASGTNQGLVAAKARLPKRDLTIPRLELVAAHMAVNLASNVREALAGFPVSKIHCWSDSSVTLHWIRGDGEYKQFVANRVMKINHHENVIWRHVRTDDNPADVASRAGPLTNASLWCNGPGWLPTPDEWPSDVVTKPSRESTSEAKLVKKVFVATTPEENEIDHVLQRFSLSKALRVCAWMRRFMNNALSSRGNGHVRGPLTTDELRRQEIFWTKQAQDSCDLKADRIALNLQPGSAGVLECRGRLQGEYPTYLPDDHLFSQRVVERAHLLTLHGGVGLTMTNVRSRYWIPRLRRLVKRVRKSCHGCKKMTATAYANPPPGVLPLTRTQGVNPYQVIGVDYAGPLQYRASKQREGKAYVLLYACSLTRGVYIDLRPTLETTDFLSSLKRFIARRGRPERIYSDNGGTFIGAAKWMRIVMKDEKLQGYLAANEIKWQFNLSRAPWWGGQFERLIGLIKAALRKSIGKGLLWWKELEEVLLDVEITLNNRPLGYIEDDIQLPILTPNSMLLLNSNILPELSTDHIEDGDLRKRAKHLKKCKEAVWKRWSKEYLRNLRERHLATTKRHGKQPAIGDVVIISSDDRKRGEWPMGVIEHLIVGKDGVVRAAKVRTAKSLLERAVQQLHPLELSCDKQPPLDVVDQEGLNAQAPVFRPRRDGAVAAELRMQQLNDDEQT